MDQLLASLHDVSLVLMPTLGALCLILVVMILYRVYGVIRDLPRTIAKVDEVLDATQRSVDSLEEPLNAFRNVATTVDKVNSSAVGIAAKAVQFGVKNMDIVSGFFSKGDVAKNDAAPVVNSKTESEDFGTYD